MRGVKQAIHALRSAGWKATMGLDLFGGRLITAKDGAGWTLNVTTTQAGVIVAKLTAPGLRVEGEDGRSATDAIKRALWIDGARPGPSLKPSRRLVEIRRAATALVERGVLRGGEIIDLCGTRASSAKSPELQEVG